MWTSFQNLLKKHSIDRYTREYPQSFVDELKGFILDGKPFVLLYSSPYHVEHMMKHLAQDLDFLNQVVLMLLDPEKQKNYRFHGGCDSNDVFRLFLLNPTFDKTFVKKVAVSSYLKNLEMVDTIWDERDRKNRYPNPQICYSYTSYDGFSLRDVNSYLHTIDRKQTP